MALSVDDLTKLIQASATVAWPLLALYVVWTYRAQVAAIIDSAKGRKFTIELGGQKLSMEEATELQKTLISDLQSQLLELRSKVEGFQVSPVAALADRPEEMPKSNAILWVDDNPKNNSYFLDLLQKRGYRVDLAATTREGMQASTRRPYRLVLSDMGRTEEGHYVAEAGLLLLDQLRQRSDAVPFVIFSSAEGARRLRTRAKALGAHAITSSTTELRALLDELAPGDFT